MSEWVGVGGCMGVWVDGWMSGWVDGWMGGWVDGWMGGWVGRYVFVCIRSSLHSVRFGQLLSCSHKRIVYHESVHRKEQHTNGINTVT